jgi:hypothetical protein
MTGYYDYVLGLIPLALFGLTGTLSLAGLGLTTAVPIAAGVAACIVGHAMFVNAPVGSPARTLPPHASESAARAPNRSPVDAD